MAMQYGTVYAQSSDILVPRMFRIILSRLLKLLILCSWASKWVFRAFQSKFVVLLRFTVWHPYRIAMESLVYPPLRPSLRFRSFLAGRFIKTSTTVRAIYQKIAVFSDTLIHLLLQDPNQYICSSPFCSIFPWDSWRFWTRRQARTHPSKFIL